MLLRLSVSDEGGELCVRAEVPDYGRAGPEPFRLQSPEHDAASDLRSCWRAVAEGARNGSDQRRATAILGRSLFRALICGDIEGLYRSALQEVRAAIKQGSGSQRLSLSLAFCDPVRAGWPWELMLDPVEELFLATSESVSISRALSRTAAPMPPLWRPPLRLLIVIAAPDQWELPLPDTLDLVQALERVQSRCGPHLARFTFLANSVATAENVRRELTGDRYDGLYFVGHGEMRAGETCLLLEDGSRDRRAVRISAAHWAEWLRGSGVRFVIFSCCDCAAGAAILARLAHLEAVVGMQMALPMVLGAAFDKAVLEALAAGLPIEDCVLAGRSAIRALLHRAGGKSVWEKIGSRPEWAAPILYAPPRAPQHRYAAVEGGRLRLGLDEDEREAVARHLGAVPLPGFVSAWIGRRRELVLPPFQIGRWPVTNHEYRHYLASAPSSDSLPPGFERRDEGICLSDLDPGAPVVGVTWKEAAEFCRWAGGRLPTADEWESAARGPEGSVFPWGDRFEADRCSAVAESTSGPLPVFLRQQGASPFGVEDLCGNVFEWTATELIDRQGRRRRAVMGGSWRAPALLALPSLRCPRDPAQRYDDVGFRCVLDRSSNLSCFL